MRRVQHRIHQQRLRAMLRAAKDDLVDVQVGLELYEEAPQAGAPISFPFDEEASLPCSSSFPPPLFILRLAASDLSPPPLPRKPEHMSGMGQELRSRLWMALVNHPGLGMGAFTKRSPAAASRRPQGRQRQQEDGGAASGQPPYPSALPPPRSSFLTSELQRHGIVHSFLLHLRPFVLTNRFWVCPAPPLLCCNQCHMTLRAPR